MSKRKSALAPLGTADRSSQEDLESAREIQKLFPSWNPDDLRKVARDIQWMASPEQVVPGVRDLASCFIPGAGYLHLRFDGKGGVQFAPESSFTPPMRELIRFLRVVLGDKLTLGFPEGTTI